MGSKTGLTELDDVAQAKKESKRIPDNLRFLMQTGIPNAEKMKSYQTAAHLCLIVAGYDKSYYQKSYEYTEKLEKAYPEMAEAMYNNILKRMEESSDFINMAKLYIQIRAKVLNINKDDGI